MKISAIIAEYNPFHLGHMYHIQRTKVSRDSKIIAIMSGNFTQRGEPTLFDKWCRARMALCSGVDMVIELPTLFATASSEGFARGAVSILNGLNAVDTLSFGSEEDDISLIDTLASLLIAEEGVYKKALTAYLKKGVSFAAARSNAVREIYGERFSSFMDKPNAILALEYIKALKAAVSPIRPYAVKRKNAGYLSAELEGPISSALSIRKALQKGNGGWEDSVPKSTADLFSTPIFEDALFPFLSFFLRTQDRESISQIRGVAEGLENKLIEAAEHASDYASLLRGVKSKRYAMARIKRILVSCLLGITKDLERQILKEQPYARVLGVKKESIEMLSYLAKNSSIPIITSPAKHSCTSLALDMKATDIYSLLKTPPDPAKKDCTTALLII